MKMRRDHLVLSVKGRLIIWVKTQIRHMQGTELRTCLPGMRLWWCQRQWLTPQLIWRCRCPKSCNRPVTLSIVWIKLKPNLVLEKLFDDDGTISIYLTDEITKTMAGQKCLKEHEVALMNVLLEIHASANPPKIQKQKTIDIPSTPNKTLISQ